MTRNKLILYSGELEDSARAYFEKKGETPIHADLWEFGGHNTQLQGIREFGGGDTQLRNSIE